VNQSTRIVADGQGPMDQLASLLEGERKVKVLGSKNLSTRHSRFGTTIKVQAVISLIPVSFTELTKKGDQKLILHKQNAIHVDPGKILDQNKKKKAVRVKMMVSLR
jgi:replication fork protection complex subunit Tof1/Swi1